MSVRGYQLRLGLFAVVSALLCVNALAPWCDALGMEVVAEGIESTTQAETVFAAGCRLAQGHLFGRAAPIDELHLGRATVSAHQHAGN